jgi:hypothetical protein
MPQLHDPLAEAGMVMARWAGVMGVHGIDQNRSGFSDASRWMDLVRI